MLSELNEQFTALEKVKILSLRTDVARMEIQTTGPSEQDLEMLLEEQLRIAG